MSIMIVCLIETSELHKITCLEKGKLNNHDKIDEDTYQVEVVSWSDNENSYTSQMVRTIKYFAENVK